MKNKYITYIFVLIIIGIILSGFKMYSSSIEKLIKVGNEFYYQGRYEEASEIYEDGLREDPEERKLNYNLANIRYQKGNYQEAFDLYQKGYECPDKYLLMGNSIYMMAEREENPVQKIASYQQALKVYKEGIIKYPLVMGLKYNYEYLKKNLETLQSQDQNKENQQNEDSGEKNPESQNSSSDKNNDKNQERNEENREQETNQNENNQENEEMDGQIEESGEQDTKPSADTDSDQSLEEIMQILEMLEKQEEDSLKNNQSIHRGNVKEEKYDW